MDTFDAAHDGPGPWSRRRGFAVALLALSVAAVTSLWLWERSRPVPSAPPVGRDQAEFLTRRTEVAFADTQRFWSGYFTRTLKRPFTPARLVFFSGVAASPCAGARGTVGPFYCPQTAVAAFDLGLLDALERQLRDTTDRGGVLLIGQIAAEQAPAGSSYRPVRAAQGKPIA